MGNKKKSQVIIIYIVELAVAAVLIYNDLRLFLLYAFIVIIWKIDLQTDYLRKLIGGFNLFSLWNISAIAEKVGVKQHDIEQKAEETKATLTPAEWEQLEKEFGGNPRLKS